MWTMLHYVDGPWRGKLAVAARPRGGDWLEDEMANWRSLGVDTVLSLLTPDEEHDLQLEREAEDARKRGMNFLSFPIADRTAPESETEVASLLREIDGELDRGNNVVIHCRQGIGRSGLVAASLLLARGFNETAALQNVSRARGAPVPETIEQLRWIDRFASSLTGTR